MKIFIAAPFGNYLKFQSYNNVIPVTGTWTLKNRGGFLKRIWKTAATLRYSFDNKGWINKLGLPNPGINTGIIKTSSNEILSIGEIELGDFKKMSKLISTNQSLEINLSCPNLGLDKNLPWNDAKLFIDRKDSISSRNYFIAKISPLTTYDELKLLIDEIGFKQIHCCNTLPVKEGGLSGQTLKPYVKKLINIIRKNWGNKIEIIAGGGVNSVEDVKDYINSGADHISLGSVCFTPWKIHNILGSFNLSVDK